MLKVFNGCVFLYLVMIVILVLLSLLFCSEKHCYILLDNSPLSKDWNHLIRTLITYFIPYSMKDIQRIAQWIVIILGLAMAYLVYYLFGKINKNAENNKE